MIKIFPLMKVTYINKLSDNYWPQWKLWKNCSEEEKNKVNLRQLRKDEIVLDDDEGIGDQLIQRLIESGYNKYIIIEANRGNHIHLFFSNISDLEEEERKEVRRVFIRKYGGDISKASELGVISIENRPHFKSGKVCKVTETINGSNVIGDEIIKEAKEKIKKEKAIASKVSADMEFKNYST